MPGPIDRRLPPFKDDPVIAALTDEQVWALATALARLALAASRKQAAGAERREAS